MISCSLVSSSIHINTWISKIGWISCSTIIRYICWCSFIFETRSCTNTFLYIVRIEWWSPVSFINPDYSSSKTGCMFWTNVAVGRSRDEGVFSCWSNCAHIIGLLFSFNSGSEADSKSLCCVACGQTKCGC